MSATDTPQTSIYEREIEDAELLAALDTRKTQNERRANANKDATDAHARVQTLLEKYELGEGSVVRVGRYVITNKKTEATDVSFTRGGGTRLQISLLDS